jgi:hypothetical protein
MWSFPFSLPQVITAAAIFASVLAMLAKLIDVARVWGAEIRAIGVIYVSVKANAVVSLFGFILLAMSMVTLARYWAQILSHADTLLFGIWLFLFMTGGMFVQVVTQNFDTKVTSRQLLKPLLFSVMVFYPIWAVAANSPKGPFSLYSAFLNGYFWQTIVQDIKPVWRKQE